MVTPFGIYLRKLRLDHGEIMKDMARKFGVSSSFLSAVENGKKSAPAGWLDKLCELYNLGKEERNEADYLISISQPSIKINLMDLSKEKKTLAFSLSDHIRNMNDEDAAKALKLLSDFLD